MSRQSGSGPPWRPWTWAAMAVNRIGVMDGHDLLHSLYQSWC